MNIVSIIIKYYRRISELITSCYYSSQVKRCGRHVRFEKIHMFTGGEYMNIGSNTRFQKSLTLTAWDRYGKQRFTPKITIGDNCDFGAFNHLTCINEIFIGNGVLTGKWVTISDNNHGDTSMENLRIRPQERPIVSKGKIMIGNNVFIGDKATILSGVSIGEGAVIGANSVVTKNIPAFCVIGGNPAKIIKEIKQESI